MRMNTGSPTFAKPRSLQQRLAKLLANPGSPQLIYVYANELDKVAHAHGLESELFTTTLERIDGAVRDFTVPADVGLIVTGDHGIIDVAAHNHILFDSLAYT